MLDADCEKCKLVTKPHTCPYKVDVNDDSESLCNCCGDHTANCADEI